MSFIDIGTLTEHRRNEMEGRVQTFLEKCDLAVNNIQKLKSRATGLTGKLNCNPAELKDHFLSCMKQLDEFTYLITDFNIAASVFDEKDNLEYAPVHDGSSKILSPIPAGNLKPVHDGSSKILSPIPAGNLNLMDVLSERAPITAMPCQNNCPTVKQKRKKIPKEEQTLIAFSSTSNSCESVSRSKMDIAATKEAKVQCQVSEELKTVEVTEESTSPVLFDSVNLPAQSVLQVDHSYSATIISVDGSSFWVTTDEFNEFYDFLIELNNYYKDNELELTVEQVARLTYCAFYDKRNDAFFRGFIIASPKDSNSEAEIYLVDTGTVQNVGVDCIQPLIARFCKKPPFVRCCHLAGIDLLDSTNKELKAKQEKMMKDNIGIQCTIEVDDNTSESLGVYVKLQNGFILNDLLVQQGLAMSIEDSPKNRPQSQAKMTPTKVHGPPEMLEPELDMDDCPEYDDPLMAVAGYSNRDEAEICKHYKGGPEKTCFKGTRCKKKHIMMHPDGWTLDKVEVSARCRTLPLPAPGSIIRVLITCVCHFDRVYVQLPTEEEEQPPPDFGVVLPPTTLKALVRDMNSAATRLAYKPLTLAPALGELVAALYPMDGMWYRARVQEVTRNDQSVQVIYVDYGNVVWVKEDAIRVLEPCYTVLPEQAVRCKLAGVTSNSNNSSQWAVAKNALADITQDKILDALVISRDYDEMTIELYDSQGYSVAEELAARNLIALTKFSIEDDTKTRTKVVVP